MVVHYGYPEPEKPMYKPKMWLCKPDLNRTTVDKIKDSYGESLSLKFSAINEFTFTIPVLLERNHKLVQNPLVDKIKDRFLIKTKDENDKIEYFMVLKINKKMDSDGFESVTYTCYSQGVQLANKLIRDEEFTSKTLSEMAREILKTSTWKLDYVDVDFDLKYRYYAVSSSNALQCIFEIAELFNAGIIFNTLLKTVSFHKPQNIGKNKGLSLREGVYLESFDLSIDPNSMVTRLKAYGQDGLEFRRLSPTGSNYIEDFSFFIYPFEADDSYNVIRHSNYWSDELCVAYKKYQKKLESVKGQFDTLTQSATTTRDTIQQREQELSTLQAQRNDILNRRDVINDTYGAEAPSRPDWQQVIAELNAKDIEIANKETEITALNSQLDSINAQLQALGDSVKVENNFTQGEIEEWEFYIIEKEYYNDSITEDEDLLEETINVFEETRQPPLELSLSMDNFLSSFEPNFDKDKLSIGDTLKLKSRDLNIDVKAKIVDLTFNYDSGDVNVTVSNTNRDNDDFSKFIEKLNLATNTSTTVNIDKFAWDEGREAKGEINDYINSALDAAKQLIQGGLNGSVTLSERGLVAVDLQDPNTWLMIQNGKLFITPDNGNHVSTAIDKSGVHAEVLAGKIILGNKLQIGDEIGVVTIQSGRITIADSDGNTTVQLGNYPNPDNASQLKNGLRIYNGSFDIRTSSNPNRGTQIDGDGIRTFNNNSVRTFNVDAATGMIEIIGSLNIKTSTNTNRGVTIDGDGIKGFNSSGQLTFQISNNGDAWFGGRLQSATGSLDNVGGTINNMGGTFAGTLNAVDGVFTGSLSAVNGTFTGELSAATGTFNGLVTGTLSADTISAIRIDADQINALKITADMIDVQDLSAISANIGTITAGTLNGININTQQDIKVGRNIYLQGSGTNEVKFADGTAIGSDGDGGMSINVFQELNIQALRTYFFGTVDFTNATVVGI